MNAGLVSNNPPRPEEESFDWASLVHPQGNEPGVNNTEIEQERADRQLEQARTNSILQFLDRQSTQAQSAPAQFRQQLTYKF